jgi:hypothetical protein
VEINEMTLRRRTAVLLVTAVLSDTYEVDNEARERALGLALWQEEDARKLA